MSAPSDRTPPSPPGIGDHFEQSESYRQDHPLRPGEGSQGLDPAELLASPERYGRWNEA